MTRRDEDKCVRDEQRGAVAELVGRRQQTELVGIRRRFDTPGIDHDVLGSGGESDEQGHCA